MAPCGNDVWSFFVGIPTQNDHTLFPHGAMKYTVKYIRRANPQSLNVSRLGLQVWYIEAKY